MPALGRTCLSTRHTAAGCTNCLAATFSTNKILSPSVVLSRERATRGTARGVVANSGCANCCIGGQGLTDATELADLAANQVGVDAQDMLVCSTGAELIETNNGLPLAIQEQAQYHDIVLKDVSVGESILLYTDGAIEVVDGQRRQLGVEGLRAMVGSLGSAARP